MRRTTFALALAAALAAVAGPAQATVYYFDAVLSGLAEAPPNASPGTGYGFITFDDVANTMKVDVSFDDLLGGNIAAHIHAATSVPGVGTAPVATVTPTFTGFPSGTTSGTYSHVFDMTAAGSYRGGFITDHGGVPGAEAFLLQSMKDGTSYLNIHTSVVTTGEIRGFLRTAIPEPSTWALTIAGLGLTGGVLRGRRRPLVN